MQYTSILHWLYVHEEYTLREYCAFWFFHIMQKNVYISAIGLLIAAFGEFLLGVQEYAGIW